MEPFQNLLNQINEEPGDKKNSKEQVFANFLNGITSSFPVGGTEKKEFDPQTFNPKTIFDNDNKKQYTFNSKTLLNAGLGTLQGNHNPEILNVINALTTGNFVRGDETGGFSISPGGFGITDAQGRGFNVNQTGVGMSTPAWGGQLSGSVNFANPEGRLGFTTKDGSSLGVYAGGLTDPRVGAKFNIPLGPRITPRIGKSVIPDNRPVENPNYAHLEIPQQNANLELLERLRGKY